jgi:hypothetical protein
VLRRNRTHVIVEDIREMKSSVFRHRLLVNETAVEKLIGKMLSTVKA